jgi:tol-pal system protein YbgF
MAALAVAMLVAGVSGPADAQDTRAMAEQIERLQADLKDLQRYVYTGGTVPPASSAESVAAISDPAQVEVRITDLENQIRELRGLSEETTFRLGQIEARLDKLVADVDARLAALERGGGAAAGGATFGAEVPAASDEAAGQTLALPEPESATTSAEGAALPPGSIMDQYNYAFGLLRKTDYDGAERALTAFVNAYPDDPLTGNAYYWLGQVYTVRNDFERAAVTYLKGYRQFPDGKYAPHSLMKLGTTLGQLGKKVEACASFNELNKKFPDAEPAVQSEAAAAASSLGCS